MRWCVQPPRCVCRRRRSRGTCRADGGRCGRRSCTSGGASSTPVGTARPMSPCCGNEGKSQPSQGSSGAVAAEPPRIAAELSLALEVALALAPPS